MAYLTDQWREKRSFDFTGGMSFRLNEKETSPERATHFNDFLLRCVNENPDLFQSFSNDEIVDVLVALDNVNPYTNVLKALYKYYEPERNHELQAWELDKRIQFLRALDQDVQVRAITDRWESKDHPLTDKEKEFLADYQHRLQTSIYESTAFKTSPYETPKPPTGPYGSQNIWSASFDRESGTLFYNTYMPQDPRELFCTFRQTAKDFQSTIAHDTDHTIQFTIAERVMKFREEQTRKSFLGDGLNDHMVSWAAENLPGGLGNGLNRMILKSAEMRNFGLLMHYSVEGDYYLSQRYANGNDRPGVTFDVYETNPSEHHTYDFQDDLDLFLAAGPDERKNILSRLEKRRDDHLSALSKPSVLPAPAPSLTPASNYPQMALQAAT